MKKRVSRRAFLRGAGKTSLALPFLQYLPWKDKAFAQSGNGDKKLIFMFGPNNCMMSDLLPHQSNNTALNIAASGSHILQPLSSYSNMITYIDNIASPYNDNHVGAAATFAADYTQHVIINDETNSDYSPARATFSINLANDLQHSTPYKHLSFGGRSESETILYEGLHAPVAWRENPLLSAQELFQSITPGDPLQEALRGRKSNVLDFVRDELTRLKSKIGREDKIKLEHYTDSITDIYTQINSGLVCTAPSLPGNNPTAMDAFHKLQIDILTAAMACGLTNVGNYCIGRAGDRQVYSHLNCTYYGSSINTSVNNILSTLGYHDFTHVEDTIANNESKAIGMIGQYYMTLFKYMLDRLQAFGILQDTLVYFGQEFGKGVHDLDERNYMPALVVDGTNSLKKGYFSIASINRTPAPLCQAGINVTKCGTTTKEYLSSVFSTFASVLGVNRLIGNPDQDQRVLSEIIE